MANWRPLAERYTKSDSKKALSELRRLPRTSFLFDENVQTNVIRAIRAYGMRVDTVRELGYKAPLRPGGLGASVEAQTDACDVRPRSLGR